MEICGNVALKLFLKKALNTTSFVLIFVLPQIDPGALILLFRVFILLGVLLSNQVGIFLFLALFCKRKLVQLHSKLFAPFATDTSWSKFVTFWNVVASASYQVQLPAKTC